MGCYIWYSEEEPGRAATPPSPLLAVPNVTAHPSTASVPTSYYPMWHYDCVCYSKGLTAAGSEAHRLTETVMNIGHSKEREQCDESTIIDISFSK